MPSVIARISGLVTYSSGETEQLAAHLDERGNISVNNRAANHVSLRAIDGQTTHWDDVLADLIATVSLSLSGSETRTVTDVVLEISGRVANDDNTHNDFAVQYDSKSGARLLPNFSGSPAVWNDAVAAAAARLEDLFDALADNTASVVSG